MADIRCPYCHGTLDLALVCEDEALRELMALIADLPREVSRPLALYIGLFRGPSRASAYERQLRLAREVLDLHQDTLLIGMALSETVEAIRAKRESGEDTRPLRNHNYLARVIETHAARGVGVVQPLRDADQVKRAPTSRTAAALSSLGRRAHG